MEFVRPGPERDAMRQRMFQQMGRMHAELRRGPPFDSSPSPRRTWERWLWVSRTGSGNENEFQMVSLIHGRTFDEEGPVVTTRTRRDIPSRRIRGVDPELESMLDDERKRIFNHTGVDIPDPIDPGIREAVTIQIDGLTAPGDARSGFHLGNQTGRSTSIGKPAGRPDHFHCWSESVVEGRSDWVRDRSISVR